MIDISVMFLSWKKQTPESTFVAGLYLLKVQHNAGDYPLASGHTVKYPSALINREYHQAGASFYML